MSTGAVRSCPPSGGPITSVTSQPLVQKDQTSSSERIRVSRESFGYSPSGLPGNRLDVQEPHILRVPGNKGAAGLDVLTHEHAEQLVGLRRVVQGYLEQHPAGRVHRRLPQLLGVHLAEALEPLHAVPWPRV